MEVVLVDDEEDILHSVGGLLTDFGHEVVSARDGGEALRVLETRAGVRLVVCDIQMPGMDGMALLKTIQARFPGTPVVLMSGYGDAYSIAAAFHHGAYDYLKKPIRLKELLVCVERVEGGCRLEAQFARERRNLIQTGTDAQAGMMLTGIACEVHKPVTRLTGHLRSIETFWKTGQGYLRTCQTDTASERKALDFILDEIPALLVDVRQGLLRIADVVRDVEAFSRPQASGERRPVNLIGCLREAVEKTGSPASGGAAFFEAYECEVVRVLANRQDLCQAFVHLLTNAALAVQGQAGGLVRVTARIRREAEGNRQQTEEEGMRQKATGKSEKQKDPMPHPLTLDSHASRLTPHACSDWVEVTVEDNGPGVAPEVQARAFDPFFTTRNAGEGLGLGLPICRRIVEAHGGEIGFESREGEGTRFWVRLPLAKDEG